MRTGLFGGTFNPIHNGHIETIRFVINAFNLDRVLFIPSAQPPHKPGAMLAPAQDRFDLVQLALENEPRCSASDIELKRLGPSFTIDTIRHVIEEEHGLYYLIVGSDAFFDMGSWKDYQSIFRLIHIIVMQRMDFTPPMNKVTEFIHQTISSHYTLKNDHFEHPEMKSIYVCNTPKIAISSTQIRDRLMNKDPVVPYVPKACKDLIQRKGLYQ